MLLYWVEMMFWVEYFVSLMEWGFIIWGFFVLGVGRSSLGISRVLYDFKYWVLIMVENFCICIWFSFGKSFFWDGFMCSSFGWEFWRIGVMLLFVRFDGGIGGEGKMSREGFMSKVWGVLYKFIVFFDLVKWMYSLFLMEKKLWIVGIVFLLVVIVWFWNLVVLGLIDDIEFFFVEVVC